MESSSRAVRGLVLGILMEEEQLGFPPFQKCQASAPCYRSGSQPGAGTLRGAALASGPFNNLALKVSQDC